MPLEIDGEKKNVSFISYKETIADSPSRSLINNEKNLNDQDYILEFSESEKIDAVYYVDFDEKKVSYWKRFLGFNFKTCCINLGKIIYFMIEIIFSYSIIGRFS